MMDKSLEQVDYKGIFRYFSEISKIPRGSGNEKAISDFLVSFAKEHQFEYTQDTANNIIMIKEATPGYEEEPAIILQGHMDMVCEKLKENTHDFLKDEIKLILEGDYLHADGTTLGADDGIAMAYIMALFTDDTLKHPRLEAIITTDEEVGMHGAKALDLSKLTGKYMINIDSEEEGYILCSCAGGLTGTSTIPVKRVSGSGKKIKVSIGGMLGGHSGIDIGKNRTNATKLLGRLLFDLREISSFGLIHMQGGFKDNVIPREAYAELFISAENTEELVEAYADIQKNATDLLSSYKRELITSEPEMNFQIEDMGDDTYDVMHSSSFEKMLFLLVNMPNGVQVMSSNIKGLVESSLNMGIFRTDADKVELYTSIRSALSSYKYHLSNKLNYMTSFLGGDYVVRWEYPAWEYKKDSLLREHCLKWYRELYGKEMKVEAIHAGLECGLISEKMPGIDIVSIGPDTFSVHTVEEKLSVSSAVRVYQYLEKIIEDKIGA